MTKCDIKSYQSNSRFMLRQRTHALYVTLKVNPFKEGGVFGISMIHDV